MKTFFKELLEYTFYFNDKVITLLLETEAIPEKALLLLNHTLNAQEVWNTRIEQKPVTIEIWGLRPIDSLKEINEANYKNSLRIVDGFDFDAKIKYSNSKGQVYENTVCDMLFHIINHSTYHRAQIATDCKINGITPLVTDYIFYKRDSLL